MNRESFRVVSIVCLVAAMVLSTVLVTQAQSTREGEEQKLVIQTHLVSCTLCFTCGGNWPTREGFINHTHLVAQLERGSGCSGSPRSIVDNAPRLCCNAAQ